MQKYIALLRGVNESVYEFGMTPVPLDIHKRIKELTLLLMYLASWEENLYAGSTAWRQKASGLIGAGAILPRRF